MIMRKGPTPAPWFLRANNLRLKRYFFDYLDKKKFKGIISLTFPTSLDSFQRAGRFLGECILLIALMPLARSMLNPAGERSAPLLLKWPATANQGSDSDWRIARAKRSSKKSAMNRFLWVWRGLGKQ
jgi:hypothetical protein